MNLVPIDTGGTPTELVGADASPGGDFAALMNGLMAGDTQIVPLLDVTTGEQLPAGADATDENDVDDAAVSILELVGTPPPGLTIAGKITEPTPREQSSTTENPIGLIGEGTAMLPTAIADAESMQDADSGSADGQPLATVHPISTALMTEPETEVHEGLGDGQAQPRVGEHVPAAMAPSAGTTRADAPAPPANVDPLRPPSTATGDGGAAATPHRPVESASRLVMNPDLSAGDGTEVEAEVEVEVEAAATTRLLTNARPGGAVSQPVMAGIARRVEEAIAALATKPDPKIVTLQLDELDGLRLTVALRPDGIHLSSTGDAALTTDIERALATRGFDMASGRDGGRKGSEANTDDGWRPQSATPGRQPRNNPSGIRL